MRVAQTEGSPIKTKQEEGGPKLGVAVRAYTDALNELYLWRGT